MHARGAAPNHILLSHIVAVVWAQRLTGCAGVIVADMAPVGVALIVVRNNMIRGFLCVARCSLRHRSQI